MLIRYCFLGHLLHYKQRTAGRRVEITKTLRRSIRKTDGLAPRHVQLDRGGQRIRRGPAPRTYIQPRFDALVLGSETR